MERQGFSAETGFVRTLLDAVGEVSEPAKAKLRSILVHKNGQDRLHPALWRVSPGSLEVVTLVPHEDLPIRTETFDRMSEVEAVLDGIGWETKLLKVCKRSKSCVIVNIRASRVTNSALLRKDKSDDHQAASSSRT